MDEIRSLGTRTGLAIASLLLGSALVLGFKTPDGGATTSGAARGTTSGGGSSGTADGSGAGAGVGAPTARPGGTSSGKSGTETVTGTLVSTRYGPVQVAVTVSAGKVTAINAVALPSGGRSGAISSYAAPILTSEALAAQSANIDLVSGATYTSRGYEQSLQAALDQAGV